MSLQTQIQLQTARILNVPLQTYEKDFSFIVNSKQAESFLILFLPKFAHFIKSILH